MSRLQTLEPQNAPEKSQELLQQLKSKIGMTPTMMRALANSPAALKSYMRFSEALSEGELSKKEREQIALAVGQANRCDYCLAAHSAIGKMVGLNPDEIRDSRLGSAVDRRAGAIVRFATQIVEKQGRVSDEDLDRAREVGLSDGEIAEIVAATSLNIFTNYFNHVADPEIDFPKAEDLNHEESAIA